MPNSARLISSVLVLLLSLAKLADFGSAVQHIVKHYIGRERADMGTGSAQGTDEERAAATAGAIERESTWRSSRMVRTSAVRHIARYYLRRKRVDTRSYDEGVALPRGVTPPPGVVRPTDAAALEYTWFFSRMATARNNASDARKRAISVVTICFRAPILAGVQTALLFVFVGLAQVPGDHLDACVIGRADTPGWVSAVQLGAAVSVVLALTSTIAFFLIATLLFPSDSPKLIAGYRIDRSQASTGRPDRILDAFTVPALYASAFLSFGALYLSIASAVPGSFHVQPCGFDVASAIYFSVSTVFPPLGGDISPWSDLARIFVLAEILVLIVLLGVYVTNIRRS